MCIYTHCFPHDGENTFRFYAIKFKRSAPHKPTRHPPSLPLGFNSIDPQNVKIEMIIIINFSLIGSVDGDNVSTRRSLLAHEITTARIK